MNQNRFKRVTLYVSAGVVLVFALIGLFLGAEQRRTQAETGAVLSAFFSQQVLHDIDQWGAGSAIEIAVQRNPDCRMCLGPGSGIDEQSWFAQSLKSRRSLLSGAWLCTIIKNNPSQLLPEQYVFDGHQYGLASTNRGSGGFPEPK